jgi:PTH2 family peptidyl-tRNA hydrolase
MYKQVIVVRTDTDMKKGKIAGQVAHASVSAFYESLLIFVKRRSAGISGVPDKEEPHYKAQQWFSYHNQIKVVLKVSSEADLEAVAKKAEEAGLIVCRIHDAGHTQIEKGTFTCIGIGPDEDAKVDAVTGDLKLL